MMLMKEKYNWPEDLQPPFASKISKELNAHNDIRVDEYYWLNNPEDPDVIRYLEAENAYTEAMLAGTKSFQEKLFTEMKSRIREKDESLPFFENGYWYYNRFEEGFQYAVVARKKQVLTATEEVLLDQNQMASGLQYFKVGGYTVSDDNRFLAFTTDPVSRRLYNLQFKDLQTGQIFPEIIPNVEGSDIAWAADNKTCFYVLQDTVTLLGYQVWRHVLGSDPKTDQLVYEEKDNRFSLSVVRSKSKKYVAIISAINELTTEYQLLEASDPTGQFKVFHPREEGIQYQIQHFDNRFYVLTDWLAPNYRLMVTNEHETEKENWVELIQNSENVYLTGMEVFRDYLVISETKNALSQLRIINPTDQSHYYISFDEAAYTASININPEFDTDTLRFSYSSMTTPVSLFDFNMKTRDRILMKQIAVLGGFQQ
ncbi:MAG: S9 family peptidase, partial [Chitinophagaceae bacterium]